jgi:hypothetical protein
LEGRRLHSPTTPSALGQRARPVRGGLRPGPAANDSASPILEAKALARRGRPRFGALVNLSPM